MRATAKLAIGARIAAARLTGRPRPFFVQYSLLNGCNARCVYCDLPGLPDPQLSTDDHLRILAELAGLGTARIKFLGGEPLLRTDLGELVQAVKRLGMRCAMVTNGFLVPDRMDVVRLLDELVISLDGDEAAHDRQRGKGTWRRALRAIEAVHREEVDFFINAVITRDNSDQVDWLLDTACRFDVMISFTVVQNQELIYPRGAAWKPPTEEIHSVIKKIIAAKQAGAPVLFSARSYEHTLNWPDYTRERVERPGQASPCTAGRYFLNVEPNGDIYPCFQHLGSFTPKNALRDGVEAAWRHAQHHSCFDCSNTWLNENRAVFDLHPSVLANFWANYLRPRRERGRGS